MGIRRRRNIRIGDVRRGESTYDIVADRSSGRERITGGVAYRSIRRSLRQRNNGDRRRRVFRGDVRRGERRYDSVENRSWEWEILGDFMHYPNAFISVHNYDCALVPSGASIQGEEAVIRYGGMWMKFYRGF